MSPYEHPRTDRAKTFGNEARVALSALMLTAMVLPAIASPSSAAPISGWQTPVPIEAELGAPNDPQLAVSQDGSAVAVWSQYDGSLQNLYANHYVPGVGWGTATVVDQLFDGDVVRPVVGIDAQGNAVAAWIEDRPSGFVAVSARFTPSTGWSWPGLIDPGATLDISRLDLAVDPSGNAYAIYFLDNITFQDVWANRFTPADGWGTPQELESVDGIVFTPQIAANGGHALAMWQQYDDPPTECRLWSVEYIEGLGWQAPTMVQNRSEGGAELYIDVGVDGFGHGVAVWNPWDDITTSNASGSTFTTAGGWTPPVVLETGEGSVQFVQVAVGDDGNATAVWLQHDGGTWSAYGNSYTVGTGWGTSEALENGGRVFGLDVGVDRAGNALAFFSLESALTDMWSNQKDAAGNWQSPELVETDNAGYAGWPQIGFDGQGNAIAVWGQSDQTRYNLFANRWVAHDSFPPPLTISEPLQGAVINGLTVWVAGTTEPGAVVTVNGLQAPVGIYGSWGIMIALDPGVNLLQIYARDATGNARGQNRGVTAVDPTQALNAQLNATLANLSLVEASLAAAEANVSQAEAAVAALEAAVNSTEADLESARETLTTAQGQVVALEGQVAVLQASQAGDAAALVAARAQVTALENQQVALSASLNATKTELATTKASMNATGGSAPAGDSGLATILALLGVALGGAALAVGMRPRKGAQAPEAAPKGAPPSEPPKAP